MLLENIFKGEVYYYCHNFIIVFIIVKHIVIVFIMFLYEDIKRNERNRIEVISLQTYIYHLQHRHEMNGERFCWTVFEEKLLMCFFTGDFTPHPSCSTVAYFSS